MALMYSKPGELGSRAPDFALPGVDGRFYRLSDFKDSKALVIVFMCNHCPYVKATLHRINQLAKDTAPNGVRFVGISSNDAIRYPADSFPAMKELARDQGLVFPYLYDESQEVAQAYGAVCTPEFYLYQSQPSTGEFILKYMGRLDDQWKDEKAVTRKELALALDAVLVSREPDPDQKPAMGCSIKWK